MPRAYINGLTIEDDGTIVRAYVRADDAKAKLFFWEGKPDKDGLVAFKLNRALIGKQLQLTVAGGRAKYIDTKIPITRLGVFHTVSLQIDRALLGYTEQGMLLPPNWSVTSQNVMANLYREAKHQNYLLTALFSLVTVASPFVGLQIDGLLGLAAGCVLSVASLLLGNYASGFSRGL